MTHHVIVGLGFGDEGKGAAVDWLCATEDIKAVIRFNGGSQAAHNVVQPDGRHHTFSQFGAGSFHGVPTYLSQYVLVNPFNLMHEAEHLESLGVEDPLSRFMVSEDALLITPYHIAANRHREELRGDARHGSTGQGIGETMSYYLQFGDMAPRVGDLRNDSALWRKLVTMRIFYDNDLGALQVEQSALRLTEMYNNISRSINIVPSTFANELLDSGNCVFEGAQGVLLDEDYGFHPHTTWSKVTPRNALELLAGRPADVIGVMRSYHTRHGAGPFPTENRNFINEWRFPEPHNETYEWAGSWRTGELDLSLVNYAVRAVGGVDKIMMSHCDLFGPLFEITHGYENYHMRPSKIEELPLPETRDEQEALGEYLKTAVPLGYDLWQEEDVLDGVQKVTGVRPSILSYGPTWRDKRVL